MKKLDDKMIADAIQGSGIASQKIEKVKGTMRISFARQAARSPDRKIVLDQKSFSELEESLRIGADLTLPEAKKVLDNIKKTIKDQKDSKVEFLKEGVFEVDEDEIEFKSSLE